MRSVFIEQKDMQEIDFGYIELTLKELLEQKSCTRNQLSVNTGIKYQTIDRYYKGVDVERVDLTLLSKICYVLECDLSDVIKYVPPTK